MIKSELLGKLSSIAFLFCVIVACKSSQSLESPTVLKSPDGKFQLTLPAGWREEPNLGVKAEIKAANYSKEMFALVFTSKKDSPDDQTLDQYTGILRNATMSSLKSTQSAPPERLTIGGNDARQFRIQGTKDGTEFLFLITTVETPTHFCHISTWTVPSRIEENEASLKQLAASFSTVSTASAADGKSSPK